MPWAGAAAAPPKFPADLVRDLEGDLADGCGGGGDTSSEAGGSKRSACSLALAPAPVAVVPRRRVEGAGMLAESAVAT